MGIRLEASAPWPEATDGAPLAGTPVGGDILAGRPPFRAAGAAVAEFGGGLLARFEGAVCPRTTSLESETTISVAVAWASSCCVPRGGVYFFKSLTKTWVRLYESRSSTKYTTGEYTCTTLPQDLLDTGHLVDFYCNCVLALLQLYPCVCVLNRARQAIGWLVFSTYPNREER